jgi:hypothetical protein
MTRHSNARVFRLTTVGERVALVVAYSLDEAIDAFRKEHPDTKLLDTETFPANYPVLVTQPGIECRP